MGVAERNVQLTTDLAAAQEHALQLQERAEAVEQALEERDANAEAEQLLRNRVSIYNDLCRLPLLEDELTLHAGRAAVAAPCELITTSTVSWCSEDATGVQGVFAC